MMKPPVNRPGSRNWIGLAMFFIFGMFVGGAIMGVLSRRVPRLPRILDSVEFDAISSPFVFVQWNLDSVGDTADLLKNEVYAHLDGLPVLGITFADDKRSRIDSVTVHDAWGRSWVGVNLEVPFLSVDLYEQPYPAWTDEPKISIKDEGADGIPDYRIHWEVPKSMCRENTIEWGPCPKSGSESDGDE